MTDFASLCILSYERPEFLKECLRSLRDAGHPYELIVHDDGSTNPECRAVIHEGIESGEISSAILNPPGHNQGQGVALNRMFGMAKGDPILKLDQDLVFNPGWLAHAVGLITSNRAISPPPGTVSYEFSQRGRTEPRLGLLGLLHYWLEPVDSLKTRIQQFDGWSSRTHILGSGFAVTRECWENLGPFEEHSDAFAEDWIFQKAVTASHDFVCGLPDMDLVQNVGMGPGPSTVVLDFNGTVATINKTPVIHDA